MRCRHPQSDMALLERDTILLISPQPWVHLHLSKHHYAIELARRGNSVYFLEPPATGSNRSVRVEDLVEYPGISVVTYSPRFPLMLRFHARPIFDRFMMRQIHAIRTSIGKPIHVVWSFEFNMFSDLRAFGAPVALFHPVDPLSEPYQVNVARSADAVFTVSDEILSNFRDMDVPSHFINHGLSRPFALEAHANLGAGQTRTFIPRVGYAGNLLRPSVNRAVIRRMVAENPRAEFHFWGPNEPARTPATKVDGELIAFTDYLRGCPSVHLHGAVPPAQLAGELQDMDCLVLSYSVDPRESDRSNSHKILEYLSTGKVIVSSLISTYAPYAKLMRMPEDGDDKKIPSLLRDTLDRLPEFNSISLQDERRMLALDNTYEMQLDRIKAKLQARGRFTPIETGNEHAGRYT